MKQRDTTRAKLDSSPEWSGFAHMPVAFSSTEVESDACPGSGRLAEFLQTAERRRPQLLRMARRLTQNSEDAEDVVQEAFLKAFKALAQFRGESQMSSWLGTIVQNTAHEHLRSRRNRVFVSIECHDKDENETFDLGLPDTRKNPEETWARTEMDAILRSEINKLSFVCRRAIELCVLEEHSQITAASALNLTTATMKSRVFRGKRLLSKMMSRRIGAHGQFHRSAGARRLDCSA
jgi:RNA polymerase sigma-70 factor (ECF subfamily)